jgi:hypothetical protein
VDEDTMRPEYDFSKAVRGVTAARYARGTNVVVLEPDVVRMFPKAASVMCNFSKSYPQTLHIEAASGVGDKQH